MTNIQARLAIAGLCGLAVPVVIVATLLGHKASGTAATSVAPSASAAPITLPATTLDDRAVTDRARKWFAMLQTGDIDRSQLTKAASDGLTADKLAQVSSSLKPLGDPTSFTLIDKTKKDSYTVYRYHVAVSGGALVFTFVLDPNSKIAGLFFANA